MEKKDLKFLLMEITSDNLIWEFGQISEKTCRNKWLRCGIE